MNIRSRPTQAGIVLSALYSRKMSLATLDHRQIAGVVKRAGEGLKPLEHLYSVDVIH